MPAVAARGEMEFELGGKVRLFRFGIFEVSHLEKLLDSDLRAHFIQQKGMTNFVRYGAFCGLLKTQKGITQPQVDDWLQDFKDKGGKWDELGYLFFEAYALGLGDDGKQLYAYLDDVKNRIRIEKEEEAAREAGRPFTPTTRELNPPPPKTGGTPS